MARAVALPGFLNAMAPIIGAHGYLAVGGLVLLEDFGVPVPGETVLIAAAVYAGAGQLSLLGVALVAFLAAVVGDNLGYGIGRLGGHALLERFGRYVLLTPARISRAEAFFDRRGTGIVVVARFVEGLRQANGLVAGAIEMAWPRFLVANVLGAALWVACWSSLGALAGSHLSGIYQALTTYFPLAIALGCLLVLAEALRRRRARRRLRDDEAKAASES